jgi:hypothetical protein
MNTPPSSVSEWVHRLSDTIHRLSYLLEQGVCDIPTDFFAGLKSPFAFFTSQQIFDYLVSWQDMLNIGQFMVILSRLYNERNPDSLLDPRNYDSWVSHCESLRLNPLRLYHMLWSSPVGFLSERAKTETLMNSPYISAVVLAAAYTGSLQLARLILLERTIRNRTTMVDIQNAVAFAFSAQVSFGITNIFPRADAGVTKGQLETALYFLLIAQHIEPDNVFRDEWSTACLSQGQMLAGTRNGSRRCLVGTLQTVRKTLDVAVAQWTARYAPRTATALPAPPQPASAPVPRPSTAAREETAAAKPLVDDAPIFDPPATKRPAAEEASETKKKKRVKSELK